MLEQVAPCHKEVFVILICWCRANTVCIGNYFYTCKCERFVKENVEEEILCSLSDW